MAEKKTTAGVTISDADSRGFLSFDLRELLSLIADDGDGSVWVVSDAEAVGPDADALHRASDASTSMSLPRLREIAANITQMISGEFRAYRPGEDDPWVILRAVDSSAFDVISEDADLLERVGARFECVRDYPSSEL